jgi:O-antigen/teichoic acid export membrane protein
LNKQIFFKALKWSSAGELATKVIQPIFFLVMTRLLTPEDYGVMAAALMVISFAQVLWEAGLGKALIQRQTDIILAANVAFWINVVMAIVFAILLFLSSELIAVSLFHDQRVTLVLQIMTLQIILGSLSSIHTSLLQKEMQFNQLFWVRLATVVVPGLFSIPLAIYGFSYWAIVVGTLIGQASQAIALWYMCRWRPTLTFNVPIAKELIRFGFWVTLTGLLVWFYLWADSFVVGAFLGTEELGLFRTANMFVLMSFDMLFAPLLPVMYSYFSSKIQDINKVGIGALAVVRSISLIAIPLSFLLFVLSDQVSDLFFGEKWKGISFLIGYLSIMRGYSWLVGINGEIYRALGKPHYETLVYAFSCIFFIAGYILSIQIGLEEFIYTRLALGMISLIPHFYLFWKLLRISLLPIYKTIIISTLAGLIPIIINLIIPNFT